MQPTSMPIENPPPHPDRSAITLEQIDAVQSRGLYLQAYHLMVAMSADGSLNSFDKPEEMVMAARLAHHCGAMKFSWRLIRQAYHRHRPHPETIYYYARGLFERRGALAGLRFQESHGELESGSPLLRADWFAQRGMVWAQLRDFSEAQRWLDRARALMPENPWVLVEQAAALEMQDRYPEAKAAIDEALRIRPWYRPAIQTGAQILQSLGDDEGSLEMLREAAGRMESSYVLMQLSGLEQELGLYDAARQTMERVVAMMPLMEDEIRKWAAFRRFDLAYFCGDMQAAIEIGSGTEEAFIKSAAERIKEHLAANPVRAEGMNPDQNPPHRVRLDVGFVRQHP